MANKIVEFASIRQFEMETHSPAVSAWGTSVAFSHPVVIPNSDIRYTRLKVKNDTYQIWNFNTRNNFTTYKADVYTRYKFGLNDGSETAYVNLGDRQSDFTIWIDIPENAEYVTFLLYARSPTSGNRHTNILALAGIEFNSEEVDVLESRTAYVFGSMGAGNLEVTASRSYSGVTVPFVKLGHSSGYSAETTVRRSGIVVQQGSHEIPVEIESGDVVQVLSRLNTIADGNNRYFGAFVITSNNAEPRTEEVIVISHSVEIASTSSLGVSSISYTVSNVYPIESEIEPASLAAAKYLETRAGPIDTTVEASYKHTSIVTSTVTSLSTQVQRNLNYDKYVSTGVSRVTTVSAANVNVGRTSTSCTSEIENESYAYMLSARGHKISNLPLGAIIRDPETRYNGKPIEWMIVSHNHPGAPAGATMLLSKSALSVKPFSGAADGNKDTGVAFDRYGREDWVNSHLRTWLNQKAALNGGVTAAAVNYNAYDKEPGFINGFSTKFSGSLLQTTIRTGNIGAGATGTYETTDKVFLLSQTEVGLSSYVQEGTPLPAEVHGLIRYAFPTQEAINNDKSGATYSTLDYTGWYLRTPSPSNDRRIRFYGTYPDTNGNWHGQVFANFGTVAVRPALNMDGNIYVSEESDEKGVYTLIYEPEVPVIKQEVAEVHSEVARISSMALRPRQEEFLSTITHAEVINTSTEAYRAPNRVSKTFVEPLYQSISKQITACIITEVLAVSTDTVPEVKSVHSTTSHTVAVESEASSEDTGINLKVDSFVSPVASYVVVDSKNMVENTVASVGNPIMSSNSKSIGATKHESSHLKSIQSASETSVVAAKTQTVSVSTHVTSCTTNSTRIVAHVVSLSTYQKLLGSGSSLQRERRASVGSYIADLSTYAVAIENGGNTTRFVNSQIEKIHSNAVMTYRGALPIVMVSEVDTDIRMSVEEPTVVLSVAEFIVALRELRR